MAVTEILAMLAVMVSADPTRANRTLSQHLGVAATVVRPPEVIAVSSADGRAAPAAAARSTCADLLPALTS